jgi:outer membrane protein assembly factor BamB
MRDYIARKSLWFAGLLLVLSIAQTTSEAADWPQFLGPNRSGISAETGLLDKWPEDGPKVVWRAEGGVGMSGLAIAGGRVVTLIQGNGNQSLVVHDAKTGKRLQSVDIAPTYRNGMGNGPRATPAISGETAYVFTGEGVLAAVSIKAGKLLWKQDLVKQTGGKAAEYGMASSPLIVGDLVVVTVGGRGATVVACDKKTGKIAWKGGSESCGYSSPTLLEVGGKSQIVAHTGSATLGFDPKTGRSLWRYPFTTDYNCNISTPLAYKGNVFISSAENHGSALLSLKPKGTAFSVDEVWTSFGRQSSLRSEWQTPILLDGKLFGLDNVGSAGPVTHLNCVDIKTGKRLWQQLRFGKSNLIAADGKLFFSTMKGELVVVNVNAEKFDELGRMKVIGTTRQAPALSNGYLYLRDDAEIVCIDVRKR